MAIYVAPDGTIHRENAAANNHAVRSNTAARPAAGNAGAQYTVGRGRAVAYWIISLIGSVIIALGVNSCFGVGLGETEGDFAFVIAPYVIMAGSLAGCILFGISFAESFDYNLWAYVLSALSDIGGIAALALVVAIVCIIAVICFYILLIALVIGFFCALLGGS